MCVNGMFWIQSWFQDVQSSGSQTQKTVMSDWNGERNVRGWLARTAVRHLESRTQGEQNQRPHLDSKMFGTIWNLTLYWLKDWMIKIWLRLLCMSRLWLYESCSFQYKTQWGHWPTSPTCPCGVWESQEVPLFDAMWFEDDAQDLILRLMWIVYGDWFTMIIHHAAGGSKQLKRYKRQHSRLMHEQQGSSRKLYFVESFFLKTRLFRLQ